MSVEAVGHPMGFVGLLAPRSSGPLLDKAVHIPLVVETFDHALIPAYEATKRVLDARKPDDTRLDLLKRSLKASAFPLSLGAALIGANVLITRRNPRLWQTTLNENVGVSYGHLLDLSCGALLGFISGTVEELKPEWVGHHRRGYRDHAPRKHGSGSGSGSGNVFESRGQRIRGALKSGVKHSGAHLIDDIKLLTVMRLFFGV